MFGRKSVPLLACELAHRLPGRARVACRALKYLPDQAQEIQERLESSGDVFSARVTAITANVLIYYDAVRLTESDVLELVESVISSYSLVAHKAEREASSHTAVSERRIQEESISELAG